MFATASHTLFRNITGALGTVVLAGVCLVGAVGPAKAAEAAPTATVKVSDLNLATVAGRQTLNYRVKAAARTLCGGAADDLRGKAQTAECLKTAIASADAPQMASLD